MRRRRQPERQGSTFRRALVVASASASMLFMTALAPASAQTDTTSAPTPTTLGPTQTQTAQTASTAARKPVDDDGPDRIVLIGLIAVAVIVALTVLWYASGHVRRVGREGPSGGGSPPAPRTR